MSPAKSIVKREDLKILNYILDLLSVSDCKVYFVTDKKDEYLIKYIKSTKQYSITKFPKGSETGKTTEKHSKIDDVVDIFRKLKCDKIVLTNDKLNDTAQILTLFKKS